MSSTKLTRRDFLRLTAAGSVGALAVACTPTAPGTAPGATTQVAGESVQATSTTVATGPRQGGTLTFGYPQITSHDNFCSIATTAGGSDVYSRRFVFSDLITSNNDFTEWLPDLAAGYTYNDNTLTIKLREGVKWHDGEPFTAQDVEFTFLVAGTSDIPGRPSGRFIYKYVDGMEAYWNFETDTISGLRVVDDFTVEIDLVNTSLENFLLGLDTVPMIPKHIFPDWGHAQFKDICTSAWATQNPVGTGPFRVTNYVVDQVVEYAAHEEYHFGRPLLDKLIYRSFGDAQTLAAAIEREEVDVGQVPPSEVNRFRELPHINLLFRPGRLNRGLAINTRQPYLADKRVRQALMYAIDRPTFIRNLLSDVVEVKQTVLDYPKYGVNPDIQKYDYDPAKAKQLLDEAGWDPDRKLRILVSQVSPADEPMYAALNEYWGAVGIQTEFQIVGADTTSHVYAEPYDFDLHFSHWHLGIHPSQAKELWYSGSQFNAVGPISGRVDELFEQIDVSEDDESVRVAVWELQQILAEESAFVLISHAPGIWALNKRVHNFEPIYALWTSNNWRLHEVWVE